MSIWQNKFMDMALANARKAYQEKEVPVGALIVNWQSQEIIASTSNLCEKEHDPTAHAEMLAIREACASLKQARLSTCDIYVTLEPCSMCAKAISLARLRQLYFAAYDPKGGGVFHGARIFNCPTTNFSPEIYGGIKELEAAKLLTDFFLKLRKKD